MKRSIGAAAGFAALAALYGCSETTGNSDGMSSSGSGTPTPAQQACLRDVSRTTNNGNVMVLSSSFSQAGTQVIVGVGPQRARWNCIAYEDGSTAGIQSLTNEGGL